MQEIDTLAKSVQTEEIYATRVFKSVSILTAELRYKICILFFAMIPDLMPDFEHVKVV